LCKKNLQEFDENHKIKLLEIKKKFIKEKENLENVIIAKDSSIIEV
jgi:hypothetical protein